MSQASIMGLELMWPINALDSYGVYYELLNIITPISKSTQNLKYHYFVSDVNYLVLNGMCLKSINQLRFVTVKRDYCLETGNLVSADQYVINIPGRLLLGYIHEAHHNGYQSGASFWRLYKWSYLGCEPSIPWHWRNFDDPNMLWTIALEIDCCSDLSHSQCQQNC